MEMGRIEVTDESGIAVVALFNEHDMSTAETFAARIGKLLDSGSRIVVDLAQARFVDSTVIGALVENIPTAHGGVRWHASTVRHRQAALPWPE